MLYKRCADEIAFPSTVEKHVTPAVATVPVNETVTAVHEEAHAPVITYPVVDAHVYVFYVCSFFFK